jgi:hypothetical protein
MDQHCHEVDARRCRPAGFSPTFSDCVNDPVRVTVIHTAGTLHTGHGSIVLGGNPLAVMMTWFALPQSGKNSVPLELPTPIIARQFSGEGTVVISWNNG